jgi:large subunit ribosomal protein L1
MPKKGKRYETASALIEKGKAYSLDEALELLPETSGTKFDAAVELHLKLGIDPTHQDQQVRGTVSLPHGTGKTQRVVVFAAGDKASEAMEAGADDVGTEDLATKIQGGWLEFDAAVATPDLMRLVSPLGRVLGPRGLMPNARTGTVTQDIKQAVTELKAGRVEFRVDRTANVHMIVGRASFSKEQLFENLATVLGAIVAARPSGAKGTYVQSATLATTMGPGIQLDVQESLTLTRSLN